MDYGEKPKPRGRKMATMTYHQKLEIIKEMESGKRLGKVATAHGISKSTLHYIFKNRDTIRAVCEETPERSYLKRASSLKYPEMEEALLNFVRKTRDNGERLTGNIIKAMALQTASEMDIAPFSASNGWLNSFARRNGIIFSGSRPSAFIEYDPIYDDIQDPEDTEAKYRIEPVEELVQWRSWCRLCSCTDTIAEFEPHLYEVLQQFLQINILETVKICKTCHLSLTGITKLMGQAKVTEKMFEELEEQERQNCLTNERIYGIRQQYSEIADNSEKVEIKDEPDEEEEVYTEEAVVHEYSVLDEESYDYTEEVVESEIEYEELYEPAYNSPKKSKKQAVVKIAVDESMYDYTCHICHEQFERMFFLSNHTRNEHNCLPQVACTCGRLLATWDSLMNHKRKHENQGEWFCDICGSKKMTKSGLKLHMKFKHLRVKPHHLCTVCGKEFKMTSGLKQHERSHLPDEEKLIHKCPHCGKRFSQKPTLRAHLRLHTAEKTIICHICSKAFTTHNYLKVHLATHEIENIACQYCDGIFKNKSSLQSHIRKIHKPGNQNFPCSECGKCFPNRNFLKRHMASHSGARNFKCTFAGCEQTYKYEKDLRNHFNIHTNVKKKCLYCDREFIDNSNMRKHVLRNHPVEVAEFEAKFGKRRRLKNLLIENELSNKNTSHNSSMSNSSLNDSSIDQKFSSHLIQM